MEKIEFFFLRWPNLSLYALTRAKPGYPLGITHS